MAGLVLAAGPTVAGAETPYMDAVEASMKRVSPQLEGTVYQRTSGNEAIGIGADPSGDWLLQTPECFGLPDCPQPEPVAFGRFLETIRSDLANAREQVDITTLVDFPDGRFREAIVDGLREALRNGGNPTVRILAGCYPGCRVVGAAGPDAYLRRLVESIGTPGGTRPKIHIASFRYYTPSYADDQFSWNHSKIIAVDGRTTIVGGHNLWTSAYLQTTNPVHDVTVRVVGPAAAASHRFAGVLWDAVCVVDRWWTRRQYLDLARSDGAGKECPRLEPPPANATGELDVLGIGRVGLLYKTPGLRTAGLRASALRERAPSLAPATLQAAAAPSDPAPCTTLNRLTTDYTNASPAYDAANPGETGLRALIAAARSDVLISQQDLLGPCPGAPRFDRRLLDVIVERLQAGVTVRIVTSTPGAKISVLTPYATAKSLTDVTSAVLSRAWQLTGSREQALELMRRHLRVAALRFASDVPAWPRGGRYALIANHAKVVQVDRRAFYVGSQNLYPSWLSEYGVLIDDEAVGERFDSLYAEPLWEASCGTAIWGPGEGDQATDACPGGTAPPLPEAKAPGVAAPRAKLVGEGREILGGEEPGERPEAREDGDASARSIGVRVRCIAPRRVAHCLGNVELEIRGPRANGERVPDRHHVIGSADFRVPRGETRALDLPVHRRLQRALRTGEDRELRVRALTTATGYDNGLRPVTQHRRKLQLAHAPRGD